VGEKCFYKTVDALRCLIHMKLLIEDKTMLKDAVSQLVSYHQDVEAILSEVLITQCNLILKSCICESVTV
jgi:hypothetical protein